MSGASWTAGAAAVPAGIGSAGATALPCPTVTDSPFSVRGSVFQVSVTGPAGTPVELRDGMGEAVRTGAIDHFGDRLTVADLGVTDGLKGLGGLVFRDLDPGPYTLVSLNSKLKTLNSKLQTQKDIVVFSSQ